MWILKTTAVHLCLMGHRGIPSFFLLCDARLVLCIVPFACSPRLRLKFILALTDHFEHPVNGNYAESALTITYVD